MKKKSKDVDMGTWSRKYLDIPKMDISILTVRKKSYLKKMTTLKINSLVLFKSILSGVIIFIR